MSLEYDLYLKRQGGLAFAEDQLMDLVRKCSIAECQPLKLTGNVAQMIENHFEFLPDLHLSFTLKKAQRDWERGLVGIIEFIQSLLSNGLKSAVLLFNGETTILLVKQGLKLAASGGFWTEERRALLKDSYELVTLPTL